MKNIDSIKCLSSSYKWLAISLFFTCVSLGFSTISGIKKEQQCREMRTEINLINREAKDLNADTKRTEIRINALETSKKWDPKDVQQIEKELKTLKERGLKIKQRLNAVCETD